MADLDWLENNAYTRLQNRSANLWGALGFLLMALLWGWPVFLPFLLPQPPGGKRN